MGTHLFTGGKVMVNDFVDYPNGPHQRGPFCFSPPILPRRSRQMLFERPLKMRLISKPRGKTQTYLFGALPIGVFGRGGGGR